MKKTKISVALAFALGGLPIASANTGDTADDSASVRPVAASGTPPAADTASASRSDTGVAPDTGVTRGTGVTPDMGVMPETSVTHSGLSGPGPTPNTANAVVNAEAAQDGPVATTVSRQAQSKGLLADSHLDLLLRNYLDYSEVRDTGHRHAWVQGAMLDYESGFTRGPIGFGADVSFYGAFKLDGGVGAGNMVHVARHGNGANQLAWAYPGVFDIKARISETVVKYGQLRITDNPLTGAHDNRSLPSTLRGVQVTSNEFANLSLEGGSFNGVRARGTSYLQKLSTAAGGTRFDRLTYAGANWRYAKEGTLSLYADQAENVWKQYYGSLTQSIGDAERIKWTGVATAYATRGDGANRQGSIDSNAYSLSLAARHGANEILLAYQKILGDQFFDYVAETSGNYLANSMDVDYNAPHEQSLQLRYTFYGDHAGVPGLKVMVWGLQGWGADTSAEAAANAATGAARHDLYWRNGGTLRGRHHEFGIIPTYTLQNGTMKGTRISAFLAWHVGSTHYPDTSSKAFRLVVNVPVKFF